MYVIVFGVLIFLGMFSHQLKQEKTTTTTTTIFVSNLHRFDLCVIEVSYQVGEQSGIIGEFRHIEF